VQDDSRLVAMGEIRDDRHCRASTADGSISATTTVRGGSSW
jgi:hypothetical protein